jgi:hypothetical protein
VQVVNNVTNLSSFIGGSIQHQIIEELVLTFQMTPTPYHVKSKVEIILGIG